MKLDNVNDVNDFLSVVDKCVGEVNLISIYGDRFCLKSQMSRYIAMGALLGEHGNELELFCENREDEVRFIEFFHTHRNTLA